MKPVNIIKNLIRKQLLLPIKNGDIKQERLKNKRIRFFSVSSIILSFLLITTPVSYANDLKSIELKPKASMYIDLNLNSATSSNIFTAEIIINPEEQNINAIAAYLNFSSSTLIAKNISFDNSFCELFIESKIDNQNGKISIICGKPNPGISHKSPVGKITFEAISKGEGKIEFSNDSAVLANDGLGTSISADLYGKSILIN